MIIAPYVHKWEGGGKFHPVLIYYVMVKIILGAILSYNDHHIQNDDRHMCTSGGREEGNSRESISSALSCYSWTHFQNDPHPTQPLKMFLKKLILLFILRLAPLLALSCYSWTHSLVTLEHTSKMTLVPIPSQPCTMFL